MDINSLKNLNIFGELKAFELEELVKIIKEEEYAEGDIIFNQGEMSSDLFILLKGAVDLQIKLAPQLGDTTIYPVKINEVFGEFTFLDPNPRSATARCAQKTTVACISKQDFDELCRSFPGVGMGFYRYVSRHLVERLRRMNDYVRDVFVRSCGIEA